MQKQGMQNVDYSNIFGFGCGIEEETYLAKFMQNSLGRHSSILSSISVQYLKCDFSFV